MNNAREKVFIRDAVIILSHLLVHQTIILTTWSFLKLCHESFHGDPFPYNILKKNEKKNTYYIFYR